MLLHKALLISLVSSVALSAESLSDVINAGNDLVAVGSKYLNEKLTDKQVTALKSSYDTIKKLGSRLESGVSQNELGRQAMKRDDSDDHCRKPVFEIHHRSEIEEISDCKTVHGDIVVSDYEDALIQLRDMEELRGSLVIKHSPNLVRVEAPNVKSIGRSFVLRELTSLALISFPSLTSVKELNWKVLPILSNVNFNNDIEDIESIVVSDTSLVGFSGFMAETLQDLNINNNRFLDTIDCDVENIKGELHIASNSRDVVVNLSKLQNVNNMSIHDVMSIDLGELLLIEATASIISNHFAKLKLPNLKKVGATLSLSKNENLHELEFTSLEEVGGGLSVVNNTLINKVDFFPKLTIIGGALEIVGNIKEICLRNLKLVKGSAIIKSCDPSFDCMRWSKSQMNSAIRGGKIECTITGGEFGRSFKGNQSGFGHNASSASKIHFMTIFHLIGLFSSIFL